MRRHLDESEAIGINKRFGRKLARSWKMKGLASLLGSHEYSEGGSRSGKRTATKQGEIYFFYFFFAFFKLRAIGKTVVFIMDQ